MKHLLYSLFALFLLVGFSACDDDSPTDPVDADVSPPSTIRASSADQAIILNWSPSSSESQENFDGYQVHVLNKSTNVFFIEKAPKGSGYTVRNLDNGTRYTITVRAVTKLGKESATFVQIEWAPAIRRSVDAQNQVIRVYATTSTTFNSGIDLFNSDGKAEVIPQSSQAFKDRGDLFVYAPDNNSQFLSIRSPHTAANQGLETQFSTVTYDANSLDESFATTSPQIASYTKTDVSVTGATVPMGLVLYGRLKRGTDHQYFRLCVKRDPATGKLVRGVGADRYIEMEVSFQLEKNVPFSKKH